MKTAVRYLDEKKNLERGISALHRELGPVEARRFIALASHKHDDSISVHRKWQDSLDAEDFTKSVMAAYKK